VSDRLCNYCLLRSIRRGADETSQKVTVHASDGSLQGQDVFVHPPDHTLDLTTEPETGNHRSPYFVCWFMEISDHCCC